MKKLSDYISNKEIILWIVISYLSVLNIVINYKSKYQLLYTVLIFVIYFIFSDRKDKKIVFLTVLAFALINGLSEALIIKYTKKGALSYNGTNKIFNIPYWLFSSYLTMTLFILNSYSFFSYFLQ